MFWVILVIFIIFLFFLLILFTRLTITLDLNHLGDNDKYRVVVRAWNGLLRYTINMPLVKVEGDKPNLIVKQEQKVEMANEQNNVKEKNEKVTPEDVLNVISDVKEIAEHIIGMHKIIRKFLKKIHIKKLEWHSQLGIGDAAHTGLITGAAWSIKGGVVGLLSQYMKLKEVPVVTITPEFNQFCSRTKFQCIFQFRIGQAMFAGIQFIKYWKGGRPKLKNKPFSFFSNGQ